jgi:hypothetical protein
MGFRQDMTAMPRDGSLTLFDLRGPTVAIVCEPWAGVAEHGDAKLTDLLVMLTNCPKARSVGIHDRCRARYDGYHGLWDTNETLVVALKY